MSLWLAVLTHDGAVLVTDSGVQIDNVVADGQKFWQLHQADVWIVCAASLTGVPPPPALWPSPWADGARRTFHEACTGVARQMSSGELAVHDNYHLGLIAPRHLACITRSGIRYAKVGEVLAGGQVDSANVHASLAPSDIQKAGALLTAIASHALRTKQALTTPTGLPVIAWPIRRYTWRAVTEEVIDSGVAATIEQQFKITPTQETSK